VTVRGAIEALHGGIAGPRRVVVLRGPEHVETTWAEMQHDDIPLGLLDQAPSPWPNTLDNGWYEDARMSAILGGERYLTAKPNVYEVTFNPPRLIDLPQVDGRPAMPCFRCLMAGVVGGVIATRPEVMACGWSRLPAAIYGMTLCTRCYGRGVTA
jgi:hypothetical protein